MFSSSSLMRSLLRVSSRASFLSCTSQCANLSLLRLLPNYPLYFGLRSIASNGEQHCFTVSYLIEKCGLSRENALWAAKSISFSSPTRPDTVLEFLRSHGFTKAQLSRVIEKFPKVLSFTPERTLLPKLDFLRSKGFSRSELCKVVYGSPWILGRSLEGHIAPSFDFISNVIRSDKKTLSAIRRYPSLLVLDVEAEIVPKMRIFREVGVSDSNFGLFLFCQPRHVKTPLDRFKEIVERVKGLGISPSKVSFVLAVQVLGQLSQSTWDKKLEIYSRWGWSEETTLRAFVKYPWCMLVSESKITAVMEYYIEQMGLESSLISESPLLISMSLEKRTMPRYSVIRALRSRGLIGDVSLSVAMCMSESKFLDKYVNRFPLESDHLLSLYYQNTASKADAGRALSML